jgi:hypothetical protein
MAEMALKGRAPVRRRWTTDRRRDFPRHPNLVECLSEGTRGERWRVAGAGLRELDTTGNAERLHWSDDAVPGPSDAVTINVGRNPTIEITPGTRSVQSVSSTDAISISGGSLSVAANSTLSGGLTMTGGARGLGHRRNAPGFEGHRGLRGEPLRRERGDAQPAPTDQ